jgi:phage-related protein
MANVTYSINSKHDDKGVKDAQKAMKGLGEAAKSVSGAIKGFIGAKVFENVLKGASECTKEYEKGLEAITKQSGAITKYQKTMGDFKNTATGLKSILGEVFGNVKVETMNKFQEPLDKIKNWLDDNKDYIVGFFVGLPEIAKRTFTLIKDMMSTVFSLEFWGNYGKNIGNILITAFKGILETLWSVVKAIGTTIWEPLKAGFLVIGDVIQDTWYTITETIKSLFFTFINSMIGKINDMINFLNGAVHNPVFEAIAKAMGKKDEFSKAKISNIQTINNTPGKNPKEGREKRGVDGGKITDAWKNVGSTFTKSIDDLVRSAKDNGKTLAEAFDPVIASFTKDVDDIIKSNSNVANKNRTVVETLTETAEEVIEAIEENTKSNWEKIKDAVKEKMSGTIDTIKAGAEGFASGGIVGGVMGIITSLIGPILDMLSNIENVGKVMNAFTTILERMFAVLEPILNELFAPFVVILEQIGEILGTILAPFLRLISLVLTPILNLVITFLDILSPIIGVFAELLAQLTFLEPIMKIVSIAFELFGTVLAFVYNKIMVPIINFVITIIGFLVNAIAGAVNFIIDLLNHIPGVDISRVKGMDTEAAKLQEISATSSGNTDYSQAARNSAAASGTGSYTAAKDIKVNIYFNHSFVNGYAREIALMIENELESAHALGY